MNIIKEYLSANEHDDTFLFAFHQFSYKLNFIDSKVMRSKSKWWNMNVKIEEIPRSILSSKLDILPFRRLV